MIRRLFSFLIVAIFLAIASWTLAQENKPVTSPIMESPEDQVDVNKVKELKDKLATKAAEIRQTATRGFFGEISAVSKTGFTLVSDNQEIKVKYDDDTAIFKITNKKTAASSKDLKNTLTVSVLGIFDAENTQINAKAILLQSLPVHFNGEITEINKTKGTFSVKTTKDEIMIFDYEVNTLAFEYQSQETKIAKSSFSRLQKSDTVHIWAENTADENQKEVVKVLRLSATVNAEPLPSPTPVSSPKASSKTSPKTNPKTSPKASPKS